MDSATRERWDEEDRVNADARDGLASDEWRDDEEAKALIDAIEPPVDVLLQAHQLIRGARKQHYGPPLENFERIAKMWSAYLAVEVTPLDVCCMMIALKIARIRSGGAYHEDSATDAAGYAGLLQILAEGKFPED